MQNRLPVKFALWDAMKIRREGVKDIANVVKREGTEDLKVLLFV